MPQHKVQSVLVQISQILGNEFQPWGGRLEDPEQLQAGTWLPMSFLGALRPSRNGPVGVEGTEVVDTDGIVQPGAPVDALLPEKEHLPLVALPVIQGIAPKLPLSSEGIWGYTGCRSQAALIVYLKQLRVVVKLRTVAG